MFFGHSTIITLHEHLVELTELKHCTSKRMMVHDPAFCTRVPILHAPCPTLCLQHWLTALLSVHTTDTSKLHGAMSGNLAHKVDALLHIVLPKVSEQCPNLSEGLPISWVSCKDTIMIEDCTKFLCKELCFWFVVEQEVKLCSFAWQMTLR
jgi:hypothetical protein